MSKTVLFQTIQFSISTQFSSIRPIDRALSGATTLGQSGPGNNGNEGVLHIPQSSSIPGTSLPDCLVSYPGHSLGEFYSYAEMKLVYSTAPPPPQPTNWAILLWKKKTLCWRWFSKSRIQTLIHCQYRVVFHKTPSVNTFINSTSWTDTEIAWNIKKKKIFDSTW